MQTSIQYRNPERAPTPTEPTSLLLRTVTGNRFPRKCSCGCGQPIPRDPGIRLVADFGAPRPYPAYLREHSPDFGTYRGRPRSRVDLAQVPGFVTADELHARPREVADEPVNGPAADPAHSEADVSPSPQAGRPWASGQLVFNAGQFESAGSGFADYAKDGETGERLRARVNPLSLEYLEQKVIALRQLHEKLRNRLGGASFGDVIVRSRPANARGGHVFDFRLRILKIGRSPTSGSRTRSHRSWRTRGARASARPNRRGCCRPTLRVFGRDGRRGHMATTYLL